MASTDNDTTTVAEATLTMVTIDCADANEMAQFWSRLLDGSIEHNDGDYSMVKANGTTLGFGRTDDYTAPTWPDAGAKQFHLDLAVTDLDRATRSAIELGATKADPQPSDADGRWVVLLDPSGHPFCLALTE